MYTLIDEGYTAFRPPCRPNDNLILDMSADDRVRSVVQALGSKLVLWNVDTFDWQTGGLSPQNQISSITNRINDCISGCTTKDPSRGGIILEHDFPSAFAIPNVLDLMMSTSFSLKTASQCAGYNAYNSDWLSRIMNRVLPPGPTITTAASTSAGTAMTSRITAITSTTTGISSASSSDHSSSNKATASQPTDNVTLNKGKASDNNLSVNNASPGGFAEVSGIWTFILVMLTIFFYI